MRDVLSLILGGGRGTRLYPLTMLRSKPAVPIAGKYRLIDIPISNCINSELNRIYVLTQFLSVSLHRHIANTYKFDPFSRGFVEVLAAQQTNENMDWYQGTADAVRQNIRYVQEDGCKEVLILSGDQLYRMDFRKLIAHHRETGADATIAVLPVPEDQTPGLGLVRVNEEGRVLNFVEKPKQKEQLDPIRMPAEWIEERGIPANGREFLANMGIYLFNKEALIKVLNTPPIATDFGKEIFPRSLETYKVQTYLFDGYWEDVGTIKAYHEASLALCDEIPPFDFHSTDGVIYTRMRYLPASRINSAQMDRVLVSDGCVVEPGAMLTHCALGIRTHIGENTQIKDTVVLGADRFETAEERKSNEARGIPNLGIGKGSKIEGAIVDKDCRIGHNVVIRSHYDSPDREGDYFVIRDGVVVIPKGAIVPDNAVI